MDYPVIEPDEKKIDQLVSGIQTKLGLELLGIDIIIENGTGRYGVIDANAFPGCLLFCCSQPDLRWQLCCVDLVRLVTAGIRCGVLFLGLYVCGSQPEVPCIRWWP